MPNGGEYPDEFVVTGLRDGVTIAGRKAITYKTARRLAQLIDQNFPDDPDAGVVDPTRHPQYDRMYNLAMTNGRTVLEQTLSQIRSYEGQIEIALNRQVDDEVVEGLRRNTAEFTSLRDLLRTGGVVEDVVLRHDFEGWTESDDHGNRGVLTAAEGEGGYREFKLRESGKRVRVRILHPNRPEHVTGADLILEQYVHRPDAPPEALRLVLLQYKRVDKQTLPIEADLEDQVRRMRNLTCNAGRCDGLDEAENCFRLKHCTSFVRIFRTRQTRSPRGVITGLNIPLCHYEEAKERARVRDKIDLKNASPRGIRSTLFTDLFNQSKIGSRPIPIQEVHDLYLETTVLQPEETLKIHLQSFYDFQPDGGPF